MNWDKRGGVYKDIALFLILGLLFALVILIYDIVLVEFFTPASDLLQDLTLNQVGNTSEIYTQMVAKAETTKNQQWNFNILFWYITFYTIGFSVWSAIKSPKYTLFNLFLKTTGGLLTLFYLLQYWLLNIIDWFNLQIIDYLFENLIQTYIPSYLIIYNNIFTVALFWVLGYYLLNRFLGSEGGTTQ